jgi:uncharacterized membrane protein YqaE (UPF0057 family)
LYIAAHTVAADQNGTMFATMRDLPYRILLTMVNIFFPPLAVMMLTGLGADTAVNSLLFLCAVIPSHVHGFYISWVYFSRRRKVRQLRTHQKSMVILQHSS